MLIAIGLAIAVPLATRGPKPDSSSTSSSGSSTFEYGLAFGLAFSVPFGSAILILILCCLSSFFTQRRLKYLRLSAEAYARENNKLISHKQLKWIIPMKFPDHVMFRKEYILEKNYEKENQKYFEEIFNK